MRTGVEVVVTTPAVFIRRLKSVDCAVAVLWPRVAKEISVIRKVFPAGIMKLVPVVFTDGAVEASPARPVSSKVLVVAVPIFPVVAGVPPEAVL
jgi:hypothetical protein